MRPLRLEPVKAATAKKIRGPAKPDRPIKLTDAARQLRCHVETLRIRIRDGRLKATHGPHGAYYVTWHDLAALPRPGEKPPTRQPTTAELEAAWDRAERYLERNRGALAQELKLFRQIRADPGNNRRLHHLISVNRLSALGLNSGQIASMVGISTRHARRLVNKRPLDALRRDLATIRSRRAALQAACRLVDQLRRQLEEEGFRYHRRPLQATGGRRWWRFQPINPDEPQPAHKVKGLTPDEVRALRWAGLTDEQIDAMSLVGIGTDEVNELMLHGYRYPARAMRRRTAP